MFFDTLRPRHFFINNIRIDFYECVMQNSDICRLFTLLRSFDPLGVSGIPGGDGERSIPRDENVFLLSLGIFFFFFNLSPSSHPEHLLHRILFSHMGPFKNHVMHLKRERRVGGRSVPLGFRNLPNREF